MARDWRGAHLLQSYLRRRRVLIASLGNLGSQEAEKLIKDNPKLLLEKGIAEDYSGRLIEGTAYQMALGAGDVNRAKVDKDNKPVLDEKGHIQILHPDEGMAEMIKGHFLDAFNQDEKAANSEIDKQQEEQFPGGYEAYINSREVKERRGNDIKKH